MKKTIFALLTGLLFLTSCEDNSSAEEMETTPVTAKDSLSTIEGEFIYLADAAVLKGRNFIYGVELDSVSMKLADSIAPLKRDEFHMIPVKVKGKIVKNSKLQGWEELVQIREIIEISADSQGEATPTIKQELDKP